MCFSVSLSLFQVSTLPVCCVITWSSPMCHTCVHLSSFPHVGSSVFYIPTILSCDFPSDSLCMTGLLIGFLIICLCLWYSVCTSTQHCMPCDLEKVLLLWKVNNLLKFSCLQSLLLSHCPAVHLPGWFIVLSSQLFSLFWSHCFPQRLLLFPLLNKII